MNMLTSIETALDHYKSELDEAEPGCARSFIERRKEAGRLMLATEGTYHAHDDDLARWADDGGPCHE